MVHHADPDPDRLFLLVYLFLAVGAALCPLFILALKVSLVVLLVKSATSSKTIEEWDDLQDGTGRALAFTAWLAVGAIGILLLGLMFWLAVIFL